MDFVLNSSLLGGYGGVVNKHPSFEQAKECWDLVIKNRSLLVTTADKENFDLMYELWEDKIKASDQEACKEACKVRVAAVVPETPGISYVILIHRIRYPSSLNRS
jgi:hypothetical protein